MKNLLRFSLALALVACGAPALTDPQPTPIDLVARGESLYHVFGCGHCHELSEAESAGPGLAHVGSIAATRRPGMSAEDYIRQSIVDPYAYFVPGYEDFVSRSFATVTPEQLDALVAYLMSLK
jgi:mono/diheme cytochrome c family protein